jgi:hypothetical protein
MKNKFQFLIFSVFVVFFMVSCSKEKKNENLKSGQVEFVFSAKALKSGLKSFNSDTITGLTWVVYSIEDASGSVIINSEKLELYFMNGDYISKPIILVNGSYKLTRVLLLDWRNKILYASPAKGSSKASLVQVPLSISFKVQNIDITRLAPEVLSSYGSISDDFGYITFGYEVSNTIDFLIGVFIYNDFYRNYELTSASINIKSDPTNIIYDGPLNAKQNDSSGIVSAYDSIGVTNKITLPQYNNYTLVISKEGYTTFSQTFTKEQMKQHFRSVDKGPLVVILEKSTLNVGLVAYYKFNGDVLDYSGNNNHGTYSGRGYFTSGKLNDANSALDLNGSTDYVAVKNATSLNPTKQISLCTWYYTMSFSGNGANSLIIKSNTSATQWYQYALTVTGQSYSSTDWREFAFYINTNSVKGYYQLWSGSGPSSGFVYELNKWYFVVGTYDGISMKLYVNGELISQMPAQGDFIISGTDSYIGKSSDIRPVYDFTPGKIDEARIYNRALSPDEILTLYKK